MKSSMIILTVSKGLRKKITQSGFYTVGNLFSLRILYRFNITMTLYNFVRNSRKYNACVVIESRSVITWGQGWRTGLTTKGYEELLEVIDGTVLVVF